MTMDREKGQTHDHCDRDDIETGRTRDEVMAIVEELAAHDGRDSVIVSEGAGDTVLTTRAELAVGAVLHR